MGRAALVGRVGALLSLEDLDLDLDLDLHLLVLQRAFLVAFSMACAIPYLPACMSCAVAGCYKTALVVHLGLLLAHQLLPLPQLGHLLNLAHLYRLRQDHLHLLSTHFLRLDLHLEAHRVLSGLQEAHQVRQDLLGVHHHLNAIHGKH
ncbi:hypothetical protein TorRG33x02_158340 [Trema orientale]|uniref:Uncharacterized protein n=1 Tax=Trema orientale TaxID=63057 RepID=A0A2P5ERS3_TREOI|nr:hypothetical protein TorRG33x02_158340 [Trema orientale]